MTFPQLLTLASFKKATLSFSWLRFRGRIGRLTSSSLKFTFKTEKVNNLPLFLFILGRKLKSLIGTEHAHRVCARLCVCVCVCVRAVVFTVNDLTSVLK